MAVRHHAFGFDGATYLDAVARAVGPDARSWRRGLATAARRVASDPRTEAKAVLDFLRFEDEWLLDGPDLSATRLLTVLLAGQLTALPSLGGPEGHSWLVWERIAPLAGWDRADVSRLIRGDPLSTLPAALGRRDLGPVFAKDGPGPGGVLPAPAIGAFVAAVARLEQRFRNPGPEDAAALRDWPPASTAAGLARAMSKAYDDACAMLGAANGRSLFLLFE